jgi:hypothetical protein
MTSGFAGSRSGHEAKGICMVTKDRGAENPPPEVEQMPPLIGQLFAGPLDVIGDIHGEIDALHSLLGQLGYAADGSHPDNRHLVFVGDLVDRGPDSPAVLRKVRDLVAAGYAQCILGNHELNLLRGDSKDDNFWWTRPDAESKHPAVCVTAECKAELTPFLESLPLALERSDLRVVHACWNQESIAALKSMQGPNIRVADLYEHYLGKIKDQMLDNKTLSFVRREWIDLSPRLEDPDWDAVMMPVKAQLDECNQMDNPVAVATSGEERVTSKPFWAGGKWRMVERRKWWESYDDDVPVIFGHYWRRFSEASIALCDKYGPDLFAGVEAHHWMGKQGNAYCVDFSVGARAGQRAANESEAVCKLAAVRVPEWEVVHDDGERAFLE